MYSYLLAIAIFVSIIWILYCRDGRLLVHYEDIPMGCALHCMLLLQSKIYKTFFDQSIFQTIHLLINLLISLSLNLTINQHIYQSTYLPINQFINQSFKQSVNQFINQSYFQTIHLLINLSIKSINQSFYLLFDLSKYTSFNQSFRQCIN